MLSLTHILSQEKMAEFLRGMQERDRYDAISTIFGTDYFDKYREGFRQVRNTLNSELDKLKIQIKEKNANKEKLQNDVQELKMKVEKNEDADFNNILNEYMDIYPYIKEIKTDLDKLLEFIISNQQDIKIEQKRLQKEYYLLKEIKDELPNLSNIREVHRLLLKEQQLLQHFKNISKLKLKVEQLLSTEKDVKGERLALESLKSSQSESNSKMEFLLSQRKSLLEIIEVININLENFSWQFGLEFLTEIKSRINEQDYKSLNSIFIEMFERYKFIKEKESLKEKKLIQLNALEGTIKKIESTDEMFSAFLSSLNQYMVFVSGELEFCPACGTEGIRKEDILINIKKSQSNVNENLPELEKLSMQTKIELNEIDIEMGAANNIISANQKNIKKILHKFETDLKTVDISISTERENQITLQQKLDLFKLNLKQFEEECRNIGLSGKGNVGEALELKNQELLQEIDKINVKKSLDLRIEKYLPEKFRLKEYNISQINEREQSLNQFILEQENEINRIIRLTKLSEIINMDIKTTDLDNYKIYTVEQIQKLDERLKEISDIENINISLQSIIELNGEKMRLVQLQKDLVQVQNQVVELEGMEMRMTKDIVHLLELMNKSKVALSNLNEKVFLRLKETIQVIFEQINSHPVFTKLDLVMDTYRNNNCLTIHVSKSNSTNDIKANAPYVFSSAQVNSIALSLFLAMSLKQKWSPLQLIGMDDPIQSMDEVNIISFIDLMRLFVEKHKKQIIISTHDQSFYKLILKKFRYYNLATIEYKAYGDKGPVLNVENKGLKMDKVQQELIYEQAKDELLQLDINDN